LDRATLDAYDSDAKAYADDWHGQPPPADLHALVRRFFIKGSCADVGCGSGREVAWLDANGYPTVGFDASQGLLAEARWRYPAADFRFAALPELNALAAASFDNVLCETVIMHLPCEAVAPSICRLAGIVRPGGVLYLSWRVTKDGDQRDKSGRLYAAFDGGVVRQELSGCAVLLDEESVSASSGKTIHRIIARRT
jgi:SAM-dependent methyltransferase